jgi:hypothetical protein
MSTAWATVGFWPTIDDGTATLLCRLYGLLLAGTLLWALPHWRRFFVSERWGGYLESSPAIDRLHHPIAARIGLAVWLGCAALLVSGRCTVTAALANLLLCRHLFVRLRWQGVLRGMGAPGFMTYWLACAVFLVEYSRHHAPQLLPLALLVLQVDYACIMLSAGVYKLTAGYPRNHGMELGLANPEWGYWWRQWQRLPPGHLLFQTLNQLAWSTEVVAALLMLLPPTRLIGALLIMVSFVFIATQIRLGLLCEMVIVCGLLFFHPGSWPSSLLAMEPAPELYPLPLATALLRAVLWGYLVLLPLAHGGLLFNFYGRRAFPKPIQSVFDRYVNFFGIIIWRVFSVDVVNFFIRVYRESPASGKRTLYSQYGWAHGLRYAHVGESIAVTSLFTTLKYYPSNDRLFVARLLRYARTVPCAPTEVLIFEYVSIAKTARDFGHRPAAEFVVDVAAGTVEERVIDPTARLRQAHAVSPVHEGVRPGSYVGLGR